MGWAYATFWRSVVGANNAADVSRLWTSDKSAFAELERLGADGWELVSVVGVEEPSFVSVDAPISTRKFVFFLKRPIEPVTPKV